ncbi:MAG: hypothetical protein K9K81_12810 [Desulfobacteraceae bacterium]|nr:hypothetical protein [Desulfobacteraceae bacterium]
MHKLTTAALLIALLIAGRLYCPVPAAAELTPLSEAEMQAVNARSGLTLSTDGIGFDMNVDTVYYRDDDGLGAPGEKAGYLSLCGVEMQGAMDFHNPVKVSVTTGPNLFSEKPVTSVNIELDGVTLDMDRFSVDAIRVGDSPGTGPSFGAVTVENMRTEISGKISIWAH